MGDKNRTFAYLRLLYTCGKKVHDRANSEQIQSKFSHKTVKTYQTVDSQTTIQGYGTGCSIKTQLITLEFGPSFFSDIMCNNQPKIF